ncbi:MAG: hypothetical protein V3U69_01900, partial [Bacteroidota bacterium]
MRSSLLHTVILTCCCSIAFSQSKPLSFKLDAIEQGQHPLPPSNSVSHIVTVDPTLWIGTSKGLARTLNGGVSWEHFRTLPEFVNDGIFAIAVRSDTIWTSTGFTKEVDDNDVQTGSGYTFSFDNGATWQH